MGVVIVVGIVDEQNF